jgi:hypothetical protein
MLQNPYRTDSVLGHVVLRELFTLALVGPGGLCDLVRAAVLRAKQITMWTQTWTHVIMRYGMQQSRS